jgi:addiction module RelB/DinJ family antitoxin
MTQTAVIHARIDPATKVATERILKTIGLTPTEAIRLLYRQIAMRGEFPVELRTPNAATAKCLPWWIVEKTWRRLIASKTFTHPGSDESCSAQFFSEGHQEAEEAWQRLGQTQGCCGFANCRRDFTCSLRRSFALGELVRMAGLPYRTRLDTNLQYYAGHLDSR